MDADHPASSSQTNTQPDPVWSFRGNNTKNGNHASDRRRGQTLTLRLPTPRHMPEMWLAIRKRRTGLLLRPLAVSMGTWSEPSVPEPVSE